MSDEMVKMSSHDWLVPFLLLNLREWGYYGHELTQKMGNFGFDVTHQEKLYRALQQMEEESLVVSERDEFDCELSQRRYFITEVGGAYLDFLADSLAQYREEIDLFFQLYNEQPVLARRG